MSRKSIARIIAIVFFVVWLAILYAGADDPPPPGFIVLILFDLAAAFAMDIRVRVYLGWHTARGCVRWLRVILEGLAAGLLLAGLTLLLPGGGEPSIPAPDPTEHLI